MAILAVTQIVKFNCINGFEETYITLPTNRKMEGFHEPTLEKR